jgi:hypothetical protein
MILAYSHAEVLFLSRITFPNGLSADVLVRHNRFRLLFAVNEMKVRATRRLLGEKITSIYIDGR